MVEMTPSG
jgi:hypothetical protein